METILLCLLISAFLLVAYQLYQNGKKLIKKPVEKVIYKNINNEWLPVSIKPESDLTYCHVIVLFRVNGKNVVTDSLWDKKRKIFTGITNTFNQHVIAWMPFPEPFYKTSVRGNILVEQDFNASSEKSNESGKIN